ncbi:MAG: DMT family transporter, partial [Bacillota bacterium]
LLTLISGAALTVQVGVNEKLRSHIKSPVLTSLVSFTVGLIGLVIVYIIAVLYKNQTVPTISNIRQTSWWMWLGGLLGAFYIFTTIVSLPKIGTANMLSLIVAGQIILAVVFDHFGILGNTLHAITPMRAVGIVLLIAGVYIIQAY